MAYEKVSLYGLVIIEKQSVSYSHIDPLLCREIFIRAAFVEGQYGKHPKRKNLQQKSLQQKPVAVDFLPINKNF